MMASTPQLRRKEEHRQRRHRYLISKEEEEDECQGARSGYRVVLSSSF